MKCVKRKLLIASAITMSFVGVVNVASAASSDVQFIGAVTGVTCDLLPNVDGSVHGVIQLGSVGGGKVGAPVGFELKADASQPGCANLSGKTAHISWMGNVTARGLDNVGGAATDAWVELKALNSKVPNVLITASQSTVEFEGAVLGKEGARFAATLNGGSKIGDFRSASAFVVAYN